MLRFLLVFFLCLLGTVQAQPWGKDADLAKRTRRHAESDFSCQTGVGVKVAERMIGFHQNVISPADGPRSHFLPSSSQYTMDAIRKYGFFKGYVLGCDRLMRENNEEWVYKKGLDENGYTMKLDPVR